MRPRIVLSDGLGLAFPDYLEKVGCPRRRVFNVERIGLLQKAAYPVPVAEYAIDSAGRVFAPLYEVVAREVGNHQKIRMLDIQVYETCQRIRGYCLVLFIPPVFRYGALGKSEERIRSGIVKRRYNDDVNAKFARGSLWISSSFLALALSFFASWGTALISRVTENGLSVFAVLTE